MSVLIGTQGSLTVGTTILGAATELSLRRWDWSVDTDALESTAFLAASNMRSFVGGLSGGSGSFDGWADSAAPPFTVAGWEETTGVVLATIVLLAETGHSYTFTAVVTNRSMSAGVGEIVPVSGRFQGSGTIVTTWADV